MNLLGLTLLGVVLLSASVCLILYNVILNQEKAAIRDRARLVADLLDKGMGAELTGGGFADYYDFDDGAARLTVISPDGTVLLDNKAAVAMMENHINREEFRQALLQGTGESTRISNTLGAKTYYYAIRLDDGAVLRVSKTMDSISGVFAAILPVMAVVTVLVLLIAHIVSRRLTENILRPLVGIDPDGDNIPVYDELIPYVKKIDLQKKEITEQIVALKHRADTIEVITGNMQEGLIHIDETGVVLIANKSAENIFHEHNMASKNILHVCRDIEFHRMVRSCLSGVASELEFQRDERIFRVYFSPVCSDGRVTGGAILFLDCTDRYEAEKQRKEFSANVSHELKTPLTTISALAEMIAGGIAKDDDIKDFAEKITSHTQRLISIIEDIIRLSEFDEGRSVRDYSEFDLYELTESIVDALSDKAAEKNVAVTIDGERQRISANKRLIDELLYNLVDNAIKYNKPGGTVEVTLGKEDGCCKITVADTGVGIEENHQSRVFERFYRVDASRFKKTGGTGLGLSIVKHIAEHHNGGVELKSEPGVGTTVICILPR